MKLLIVDSKDKFIGYKDKDLCHKNGGIRHRAFSILVFNKKGELLIQKRSRLKTLWPLYWSNTCCSHPTAPCHSESFDFAQGEASLEEITRQAQKRLKEEMGFSCDLKFVGKLKYQAKYKDKGSEKEITYIFKGKYDGKVTPHKNEVAEFCWVNLKDLKSEIKDNPDKFTPWFKKILLRQPRQTWLSGGSG